VAFPLRLDRRTATTWRSRGPFTPGRLDYVLFSGSSLEAVGAFVFDAADLGDRWRREHAIEPDDSGNSSDHLPVVVDLRLRQRS
jgi:endonuclease/exonuclease/phosphatase family metal-dependent hydrolase